MEENKIILKCVYNYFLILIKVKIYICKQNKHKIILFSFLFLQYCLAYKINLDQ